MENINVETFERLVGEKITTFLPTGTHPSELNKIQMEEANFEQIAECVCEKYVEDGLEKELMRFVKYFAICEDGQVLPPPEPDIFFCHWFDPPRKVEDKGILLGIGWNEHPDWIKWVVKYYQRFDSKWDSINGRFITLYSIQNS